MDGNIFFIYLDEPVNPKYTIEKIKGGIHENKYKIDVLHKLYNLCKSIYKYIVYHSIL